MLLEQITLGQFLQWLFVGGGLAVLLQRIPGWDNLPSNAKLGIVAVLNLAGPALLAAIGAYIPADAQNTLIANLIFGAFSLAASFVVHKLDELLANLGVIIQQKALS